MADVRIDRDLVDGYARTCGDVATDLADRSGTLGAALEDLRIAPETFTYLGDVPPLELDLLGSATRLDAVAAGVAGVVAAIVAVDEHGVGVLDDARLERLLEDVPDIDEALVTVTDDGRVVVDGSDRSEHVQVIDNGDGTLTIRVGVLVGSGDTARVDYTDHVVDAGAGDVVVRTGGGDDVIDLPIDSDVTFTVSGGDGDDVVGGGPDGTTPLGGSRGDDVIFGGDGYDILIGGAGDDRIHGGAGTDSLHGQGGNDTILGGDGYDVVYGGRGDDTLVGGAGDDALEGGSGDDNVDGGDGDDLVSGGDGDDVLGGGAGDDHLFAGAGDDDVSGGGGFDRATVEDGDTTDTALRIEIEIDHELGADAIVLERPPHLTDEEWDAWVERMDSDLDLIRQTEAGREGLAALDDVSNDSDSGWNPFDDDRRIVVRPYADADGAAEGFDVQRHLQGGSGLAGSYAAPPGGGHHDASVNYNTLGPAALDDRPPVHSLYHELAHSHDQLAGGTQDGRYSEIVVDAAGNEVAHHDERDVGVDAAGNPYDLRPPTAEINSVGHDVDGDGDIDTTDSAGGRPHPTALTENALREELGIDERPSYTFGPDQVPEGGHVRYEDVVPELTDE